MKRKEEERTRQELSKKQGSLKPEPPEGAADVVEIQINLPNGVKKKRRFLSSDSIRDVMNCAQAFDISLTKFQLRWGGKGVVWGHPLSSLSLLFSLAHTPNIPIPHPRHVRLPLPLSRTNFPRKTFTDHRVTLK